jgi:hypothetical protein
VSAANLKLNLSIGKPKNIRHGYTNVDPFAKQEDDSYKAELHQLDSVVDDGEAVEMIALDVIEYYPYNDLDILFQHWWKKLKKGAKLTVDFYEIRRIAKDLVAYRLSLEEFNKVIAQSFLSMEEAKVKLEAAGFTLLHAKFADHKGIIICQK